MTRDPNYDDPTDYSYESEEDCERSRPSTFCYECHCRGSHAPGCPGDTCEDSDEEA